MPENGGLVLVEVRVLSVICLRLVTCTYCVGVVPSLLVRWDETTRLIMGARDVIVDVPPLSLQVFMLLLM